MFLLTADSLAFKTLPSSNHSVVHSLEQHRARGKHRMKVFGPLGCEHGAVFPLCVCFTEEPTAPLAPADPAVTQTKPATALTGNTTAIPFVSTIISPPKYLYWHFLQPCKQMVFYSFLPYSSKRKKQSRCCGHKAIAILPGFP